MRHRFQVKIATLVIVIFTMTAPAFAAAPRDDSPFGPIERAIERVVNQLKKIFYISPTDLPVITNPK